MFDQTAQVAHRSAGAFERPQLTMIMECVASDHPGVAAVAVRDGYRAGSHSEANALQGLEEDRKPGREYPLRNLGDL